MILILAIATFAIGISIVIIIIIIIFFFFFPRGERELLSSGATSAPIEESAARRRQARVPLMGIGGRKQVDASHLAAIGMLECLRCQSSMLSQ